MKKLIALIFSFALLFSIAACSIQTVESEQVPELPQIEEKYVDCVNYLKSHLKDPESLRIYGDIYAVQGKENPNYGIVQFLYDAKNGYGAYNGAEGICIPYDENGPQGGIPEGDEYYMDLKYLYDLQMGNHGKSYDVTFISGEDMAKVIGCEHFDY